MASNLRNKIIFFSIYSGKVRTEGMESSFPSSIFHCLQLLFSLQILIDLQYKQIQMYSSKDSAGCIITVKLLILHLLDITNLLLFCILPLS